MELFRVLLKLKNLIKNFEIVHTLVVFSKSTECLFQFNFIKFQQFTDGKYLQIIHNRKYRFVNQSENGIN